MNKSKVWARAGLAIVTAAVLTVAGGVPASAAVDDILCQSSIETINNGTYFSQTQNRNLKCAGVANRAYININGQLLWSSYQTPVSGKSNYYRSYAGVVWTSRHYHNGTYKDLDR
jgi:hypothetical protein